MLITDHVNVKSLSNIVTFMPLARKGLAAYQKNFTSETTSWCTANLTRWRSARLTQYIVNALWLTFTAIGLCSVRTTYTFWTSHCMYCTLIRYRKFDQQRYIKNLASNISHSQFKMRCMLLQLFCAPKSQHVISWSTTTSLWGSTQSVRDK
jgi:hypothetical protein